MMFHKRLNQFIKTTKVQLISAVLFSLLSAVFIVFQAKYLSSIINDIFLNHYAVQTVLTAIFILVFISMLRLFSDWFSDIFANKYTLNIKLSIKKKLVAHLNTLSPLNIQSEKRGELVTSLNEGIQKLDAYFSEYIPQIARSVLLPVIYLFFVFPADILTGAVLIITAPLIPVFMVLIGSTAQAKTKEQWESLSRLGAYFLDTIQGLMTLKLFGRSEDRKVLMNRLSSEFSSKTMDILKIAFLSALVLEMVATIATAVVAVEVGIRLLYGKMLFADALFVLIIAPEFYMPLRMLGSRFHSGTEGIAAAERLFEILDIPIDKKEDVGQPVPDNIDIIRINDLTFSYETRQKQILQNVSFTIEKNRITAIAGETGSGKSTIAHLLLRYLKQQSGEIRINDMDISQIHPDLWRKQIAYIQQMPFIFDASIRQNLTLAKMDAGDEELYSVLKQVYLYDFVNTLPEKLETAMGEKGFNFSGGQIQRLSIARALLKSAPILIFDEITSSMDPESEILFLKALDTIKKDKLILLIAHRSATIKHADMLYVLEKENLKQLSAQQHFKKGRTGEML